MVRKENMYQHSNLKLGNGGKRMSKKYIIVDRWGETAQAVRNKMKKSNIVIDSVKLQSRMSVKSNSRRSNMNRYSVKYHRR